MDQIYLSILAVSVLFLWILLILPLFDSIHSWFFQISHREIGSYRYFDWFVTFFRVIKQRSSQNTEFKILVARKSALFFSIVLSLYSLALLPLSTPLSLGNKTIALDLGSSSVSAGMIIVLLFLVEAFSLLIGFTFKKPFFSNAAIEKSALSHLCILILTAALITLPHVHFNSTLSSLLESQVRLRPFSFWDWGIFQNPFSFMASCLAIIIYLQQWLEDEYPQASILPRSYQNEFIGPDLVTLKIARSLKFLLLYAFLVTLYFGGPYLWDTTVNPIVALGTLTGKIFFLAIILLAIQSLLPQLNRLKPFRMTFLFLLPALAAGYPISLFLREVLRAS